MAGVGLDADQLGCRAGVGGLQRGGVFEAVRRHDAVVVVAGGDEHGRVFDAALDVVQRRVSVQGLEHLGVVAGAVVGGPGPADREVLVAQHVHHAHLRHGRGEQLRALVGDRAHQQAAIAAAVDGERGRAGNVVLYQPFSGGDEVVEDVLLLQLGAGIVPGGAVFTAATDGRDDIDAAHLEPGRRGDAVGGGGGDVEAAVAVEQRGVAAVELETLLGGDEDREARAVLAGDELAAGFELVGVEGGLGRLEQLDLAGPDVVAVDLGRRGQAGVAEEGVLVVPAATEAAGRADARQLDLAQALAVGGMHAHQGRGVVQIAQQEAAANGRGAGHRIGAFGHQGLPRGRGRVLQVDGHQATAGRVPVGLDDDLVTQHRDRAVLRVELQRDRLRLAAGKRALRQRQHHQAVLAAAFHDADQQQAAIVGHLGAEAPFLVIAVLGDEDILGLRSAQAVVVELLEVVGALERLALLGGIEAGVEEALAIGRPGGAAELDPFDGVRQVLAGGEIAHPPGLPVGAGAGHAIGQQLAVTRGRDATQGHRAVLAQRVGVERHLRRVLQRGGRVEHALGLQAAVVGPEIALALAEGDAELLEVIELGVELAHRQALRHGGEEFVGDLVLLHDPGLGVGAVVVFQPAVGVGHRGVVIGVDLVDLAGDGVADRLALGAGGEQGGKGECGQGELHQWGPGFVRRGLSSATAGAPIVTSGFAGMVPPGTAVRQLR
mmetsp:Transcript_6598/g.27333  ORF Transcript_6598/g.27333 Transcript_6598/m.27333 type:complete len:718 (+) Transcript_6598:973-3126(+)